MADRLATRQWLAKWANIVISAAITGGAVTALFSTDTKWAALATTFLSIASLIFNAYLKDLDPGALAQRHREAASDIWNIREGYLSLLTDALDEDTVLDDLRTRRDLLQDKLYKIYHGAPPTDGKAYGEAQDAIKKNEELTFSEPELDHMLPGNLRRSGRSA